MERRECPECGRSVIWTETLGGRIKRYYHGTREFCAEEITSDVDPVEREAELKERAKNGDRSVLIELAELYDYSVSELSELGNTTEQEIIEILDPE